MESESTVKPIACVALLVVIVTAAQADSHDRDEQLVYALTIFDGSGYSSTFSAEDRKSVV